MGESVKITRMRIEAIRWMLLDDVSERADADLQLV